jgi:hypothetical protein
MGTKNRLDDLRRLARHFLDGGLPRADLALHLHGLGLAAGADETEGVCSGEEPSSLAATVAGLLTLILEAGRPPRPLRLHRLLRLVEGAMDDPWRSRARLIPALLRELGPLRLRALESPLGGLLSRRCGGQWVDIGLLACPPQEEGRRSAHGSDEVRLIPFSIFTRSFFHETLPRLLEEWPAAGAEVSRLRPLGRDPCSYHPENDKAHVLRERHPLPAGVLPGFQYFVDASGLAEVILDRRRIGRREIAFAARLFCLLNRVRGATLDGRRVAGIEARFPR